MNPSAILRRLVASLLVASVAVAEEPPAPVAEEAPPAPVIRWTDLAGVPHLSSTAPKQYEVTREEWLRLKDEYPGVVKEEAAEVTKDLSAMPPGLRAEAALRDWWNIAGPKGGYRGTAVVSAEDAAELGKLMAIAREALKEARGNDFSPATGRAAADMRRADAVRVEVRDGNDLAGIPLERAYPVRLEGNVVKDVATSRFDVKGRISNRTARDANGLVVSLFLHLDGRLVGTREVVVPRLMARGEAPIQTSFNLDRSLGPVQQGRLSVTFVVEQPPSPSGS